MKQHDDERHEPMTNPTLCLSVPVFYHPNNRNQTHETVVVDLTDLDFSHDDIWYTGRFYANVVETHTPATHWDPAEYDCSVSEVGPACGRFGDRARRHSMAMLDADGYEVAGPITLDAYTAALDAVADHAESGRM